MTFFYDKIDGKEDWESMGGEAVYAFKDERLATFDTFTMLIPDNKDQNVKEFELLVANGDPTGVFQSIGKFQTKNMKLFKTPYQEFTFRRVKAKYLKYKTISNFRGDSYAWIVEFQLFGKLE